MPELLEIQGLSVSFALAQGRLAAVDDISFVALEGKTTGIVGESGCGKSVTAFSIMRLIPQPPGEITAGRILFQGEDLLTLPIDAMRKVRGRQIAMIFQEPMTALNPVYTIGRQMEEVYLLHFDDGRAERKQRCIEMLRRVGIPAPERRILDYPHQLSGGMRQRVMIAMALSLAPRLLIADEPTTALDVTIQAQILALMNELKVEMKMTTLLITHDLGVVAETCDEVLVMYAGKIVERAPSAALFAAPCHPYTRGLLDSLPSRRRGDLEPLATIEGMVPDLFVPPVGCRFFERCRHARPDCRERAPELVRVSGSAPREVACHYPLS